MIKSAKINQANIRDKQSKLGLRGTYAYITEISFSLSIVMPIA